MVSLLQSLMSPDSVLKQAEAASTGDMGSLGPRNTDIISLPSCFFFEHEGQVIKCIQRIDMVLARMMSMSQWFRQAMVRAMAEWTWLDHRLVEGAKMEGLKSAGVYILLYLGVSEMRLLEQCTRADTICQTQLYTYIGKTETSFHQRQAGHRAMSGTGYNWKHSVVIGG
jgi:hypothetical protein